MLFIFLARCEKEEQITRDYPILKTLYPANITIRGARFDAVILNGNPDSVLEYGFAWGTSLAIDSFNAEYLKGASKLQTKSFSINMSHTLEKNQKYFVRSYIRTSKLDIYGNLVTFSVPLKSSQ